MDWRPIETAPKNASDVILFGRVRDGRAVELRAHFAQDLSGSEQPPFKGWFYSTGYGFAEIWFDPEYWKPASEDPLSVRDSRPEPG